MSTPETHPSVNQAQYGRFRSVFVAILGALDVPTDIVISIMLDLAAWGCTLCSTTDEDLKETTERAVTVFQSYVSQHRAEVNKQIENGILKPNGTVAENNSNKLTD